MIASEVEEPALRRWVVEDRDVKGCYNPLL